MTQDELKTMVALAALPYVTALEQPAGGLVIGVGTGSTVDRFIDAAGRHPRPPGRRGVEQRAQQRSACARTASQVLDSNQIERVPLYVDGADEIDASGCMIKGGGAALTREKIVADIADRFLCIADVSKQVDHARALSAAGGGDPDGVGAGDAGPVARSAVGRCCARASSPTTAASIVDVHGLSIDDPAAMECEINQWPGVVSVGIFARNRASLCLLGADDGVRTLDILKPRTVAARSNTQKRVTLR